MHVIDVLLKGGQDSERPGRWRAGAGWRVATGREVASGGV